MGSPPRSSLAIPMLIIVACCLVSLQTAAMQFAPSQTEVPQERTTPLTGMTVVDLSVQDLLACYGAELGDLVFDQNQQALGFLLQKVGENVDAFFHDILNTTSKEKVLLQRLNENGRLEASAKAEFNYLLLVNRDQKGTNIEEYRADSKGQEVRFRTEGKELPLKLAKMSWYVVTSGFAGHCIFLHPSHHFGSRFRYLGRQTSEPHAQVIAFAQRPESGDFLVSIDGKKVMLQGFVWVDPRTFQILRMRTDLLGAERLDEPRTQESKVWLSKELGFDGLNEVRRQTTEVWFSKVHIKGIPQAFWLPREVVVTLEWGLKTFRNVHSYSDYKLFTVATQIRYGPAVNPPIKK